MDFAASSCLSVLCMFKKFVCGSSSLVLRVVCSRSRPNCLSHPFSRQITTSQSKRLSVRARISNGSENSNNNSSNSNSGSSSSSSNNMQQPDCLAAVAEFHRLFQAPILRVPTIPSADRCALRVNLIREELNELADAIKENDLVEVADALADIQYVLSGAVLEFGFGATFELLFNEVQRSNMSKACANPHEAEATRAHYKAKQGVDSFVEQLSESQFLVFRAGDKKVLKSVNYSPANLPPILSCAGEVAAGGAATVLPMPNTLNAVAAFHRLFKAPILPTPQIPAADRCALRVSLITEELQELEDAIKEKDLIEIADALADIQYVLSGAVLEFGMGDQFEALFDEVHRSNMSKACATADEAEATRQHYRENYNPPTESTIEEVCVPVPKRQPPLNNGCDKKYAINWSERSIWRSPKFQVSSSVCACAGLSLLLPVCRLKENSSCFAPETAKFSNRSSTLQRTWRHSSKLPCLLQQVPPVWRALQMRSPSSKLLAWPGCKWAAKTQPQSWTPLCVQLCQPSVRSLDSSPPRVKCVNPSGFTSWPSYLPANQILMPTCRVSLVQPFWAQQQQRPFRSVMYFSKCGADAQFLGHPLCSKLVSVF